MRIGESVLVFNRRIDNDIHLRQMADISLGREPYEKEPELHMVEVYADAN